MVDTTVEAIARPARRPPVKIKGTERGLEIVVDTGADAAEIADSLAIKIEQWPGFFANNDVFVRCDGPLPAGVLARLAQLAERMELRIVEIGPAQPAPRKRKRTAEPEPPPAPALALAPEPEPEPEPAPAGPQLIAGPVRSGMVVTAPDHMVVLGDVNPGAELRARGSIIVLGALRGIAHAACDGATGFIFALKLAPQQLRIGQRIARAGDADNDSVTAPEIAYATGEQIIVEHYRGKLPRF